MSKDNITEKKYSVLPNYGFKAWNHVPKKVCLGVFKCFQKIIKNMT